ncbi:MAG: methanogen output domain 1-containing protein [Candidatus Helarchaeota archaeon]
MSNIKINKLPSNSIEAQGLLIKAFYKKFGDETLSIIDKILSLQGRALGFKIKKKLQNNKLSTIAQAFTKNFDSKFIKVISISDKKFHIQGTKCPFGLENTSRKLCEAVMAIDREYFYTATDGKSKLEIIKTRAEGDPVCDTIYTISENID